jgi:hypothetical protein
VNTPRYGEARLAVCLTAWERRSLLRLIAEGPWPFGPGAEAALEALLARAGDEEMELLIKCCSVLELEAEPVPAGPARALPDERLRFAFDPMARDLEMFLTTLERNGLDSVVVETGHEVVVFVTIVADTDLEFRREVDRVHGLREIARSVRVTRLRGRRVPSRPGPGRLWPETDRE